MKRILQSLLLLLVVAGVSAGIYQKLQKQQVVTTPVSEPVVDQGAENTQSDVVTVTYFTSDVRCASCKEIEALTQATVNERFAEELNSGALVFETHNIDQPQNKHFVDAYQLSFKTVVISMPSDEGNQPTWQRMDQVWELLNQPEAFKDYLDAGIREMLSKQV